MAEMSKAAGVSSLSDIPLKKGPPETFEVGDTRVFKVADSMFPHGEGEAEFKCLYVGEHCYVWTPTSDDPELYPLDKINEDFAAVAAAEFTCANDETHIETVEAAVTYEIKYDANPRPDLPDSQELRREVREIRAS